MSGEDSRLAVDCVVFDGDGRLLLIRRKFPPFKGQFALPGGFVETGETTEEAARRELKEETGISAVGLNLIGVYSDPRRDPRQHTVSIAYLSVITTQTPKAGDDAEAAAFLAEWKNLELAFDHGQIATDAWALKKKLAL